MNDSNDSKPKKSGLGPWIGAAAVIIAAIIAFCAQNPCTCLLCPGWENITHDETQIFEYNEYIYRIKILTEDDDYSGGVYYADISHLDNCPEIVRNPDYRYDPNELLVTPEPIEGRPQRWFIVDKANKSIGKEATSAKSKGTGVTFSIETWRKKSPLEERCPVP